jgi:hypothetical protein
MSTDVLIPLRFPGFCWEIVISSAHYVHARLAGGSLIGSPDAAPGAAS